MHKAMERILQKPDALLTQLPVSTFAQTLFYVLIGRDRPFIVISPPCAWFLIIFPLVIGQTFIRSVIGVPSLPSKRLKQGTGLTHLRALERCSLRRRRGLVDVFLPLSRVTMLFPPIGKCFGLGNRP